MSQHLEDPPVSRTEFFREILHGVQIVDLYRWLEDGANPETRAWIDAQNRYTHAMLDGNPSRAMFKKRFTELMRVDRSSLPLERNGIYFYMKRKAQEEQWMLYMKDGNDGAEIILLDPKVFSPLHSRSLSLLDVSPDGSKLVYGIREGGRDELQLRILDVRTRRDIDDSLPEGVIYGLGFKNDNSGFYYSFLHRDIGPRLYFHQLGTDYQRDLKVFGDGIGPEDGLSIGMSQNGEYVIIIVERGWTKNDVYLLDTRIQKPATAVVEGLDGIFIPQLADDQLFIYTDWKNPAGQIFRTYLDQLSVDYWKEIIPAGKDIIKQFILAGDNLVVHYLINVTSGLKVFSPDGSFLHEITLPGLCTVEKISTANSGTKLLYDIQSFNRPHTIYSYNFMTMTSKIWAVDKVPIEPDLYIADQVWYSSKDGTQVPMFLVYKKGLEQTGDHPTLLYGYGGFNVSITPSFNPNNALWIEQGGIYAVANIRGGGEFGKNWHRGGILENKQNAIDDFIAASEWLIENRYTNPEKLAIQGESNGGLLVGAAMTQRPELYRAVLCEYPVLDIIGYPRYATNPAAMYEYGDASRSGDFQYILKYSPYQNIHENIKYPAVLFITGDSDTRVPPLHARKMTARLQAVTKNKHPVLLWYDTKAGHSGGKTLAEYIDLFAYKMSFLYWQLDLSYEN